MKTNDEAAIQRRKEEKQARRDKHHAEMKTIKNKGNKGKGVSKQPTKMR